MDVIKQTRQRFMVSGAGCGKSRNATEIPKILRKIFVSDPELGPCLQETLIFNIWKAGDAIFKDTPLLHMLINDMSGNSIALEALELALKEVVDFENISFVSIAEV
ncbi:14607_t:CDS:2, partial [Funneliformis geosporum]